MIVYSERGDRLGGRLCAMVNGLRMAATLGAEFKFGWPTDNYRFENLDDVERLLAPDFIAAHRMGSDELKGLDIVRFDLLDPMAPPPAAIRVDKTAGVALLPGEDEADVARQCRDAFATSGMIAPHILAAVESLADQLGLNDDRLAALHIRRGDVVEKYMVGAISPEFLDRYNPVQYFIDWGAKALKAGTVDRLVVFTEDDATRQALSGQLDNTVACHTLRAFPHLTAVEAALVEMLLMARCSLIVGGYSAFSHFPCLVGTPRKLSIRDELTAQERLAALATAAAGPGLIGHEPNFISILMLEDGLRAGQPDAMDAFLTRCQGDIDAQACAGALLRTAGFTAEAATLLHNALSGGRPLLIVAAWNNLALALGALGRIDEALEVVDAAMKLKPNRWELTGTKGGLLIAAGAREDGLALLRQSADLAPLVFRAQALATLAKAEADKETVSA